MTISELRSKSGLVFLCERYLTEVPCNLDIVPGIVIKFAVDGLHQGLEGPGAQVDDQRDGAVLQRQVDVVGRLARVEHEAVALQRLEGEGDLVAAALDGVGGQVVAEVLRPLERGHMFFFHYRGRQWYRR